MSFQLDRIDRQILAELQADWRLSIVELSRRVNLTKTPCAERVKRPENAGIIRGYHGDLDPEALDARHIVFVQVSLSGTSGAELDRFNKAARLLPEIQSCHMIAGGFDYRLKIRARDIAHFRARLGDRISRLPGVQSTHTYVVMKSIKDESAIPVNTTG